MPLNPTEIASALDASSLTRRSRLLQHDGQLETTRMGPEPRIPARLSAFQQHPCGIFDRALSLPLETAHMPEKNENVSFVTLCFIKRKVRAAVKATASTRFRTPRKTDKTSGGKHAKHHHPKSPGATCALPPFRSSWQRYNTRGLTNSGRKAVPMVRNNAHVDPLVSSRCDSAGPTPPGESQATTSSPRDIR